MAFPRYYGQRSAKTASLAYPKSTKVKASEPAWPVIDAVAAAVIAYKQNANKIEKFDTPAMPATEYNPATPVVVSNKSRALAVLANPVQITQEDRDIAAEVISYLQGQATMGLLSGRKVSDFARELVTMFDLESIPRHKIGMLVYAPNSYYTGKLRDSVTEETTECMYSSQALGQVGDKVTIEFSMLEKRFINQLNCFAAYGKDEKGNLVSFITKHEHLCKSAKLTGKVKSAAHDKWHHDALVTSLNFVKAAV
jgi:hypothetical protein